jgi:short-subunit dehydrogenase
MKVLITGAAGGLGRAMAMECARRGYDMYLTDRDAQSLKTLAAGIRRQYGAMAEVFACDLTDAGEVAALFTYIQSKEVPIDMLLHVAGIDFEGGFLEMACDRFIDIVRVNIEGSLRILHGALRLRDAHRRFSIVVVSSLASLYPMPLKATYAASKRFLLDFSVALSQELRGENASVLALCPGGLPTTEGAIRGIEAQGFFGRITTSGLATVARVTITKALKGRRTYIPGAVNRIFSVLGRLVPRQL